MLNNLRNIFGMRLLASMFLVIALVCAAGRVYASVECTDYGDCVFCVIYSQSGEYQGFVTNCYVAGGGSASS